MRIVGVTACMSGVAHTYMAAELLEKLANKHGYKVLVETQGALGSEDKLTQQQIDDADVALIIADINIEGEQRFQHSRVVKMSISHFLRDSEKALQAAEKIMNAPRQKVINL